MNRLWPALLLGAMLCLARPCAGADHTLTTSTLTRGTLTFTGKSLVFKGATIEERFDVYPVSGAPGLGTAKYEYAVALLPNGKEAPASQITLLCEDQSKLVLTEGRPVEVIRIELEYTDRSKVILWKLASDLK